jgi:hypothetical protein
LIFQVLNKVTGAGGEPRGTRRSSGGRRLILKALELAWFTTDTAIYYIKYSAL